MSDLVHTGRNAVAAVEATEPDSVNKCSLNQYLTILSDTAKGITKIFNNADLICSEELKQLLHKTFEDRVNDYFGKNFTDSNYHVHSLFDAVKALRNNPDLDKAVVLRPWAEAIASDLISVHSRATRDSALVSFDSCSIGAAASLSLDYDCEFLESGNQINEEQIPSHTVQLMNARQQIVGMINFYLDQWLPLVEHVNSKGFQKLTKNQSK